MTRFYGTIYLSTRETRIFCWTERQSRAILPQKFSRVHWQASNSVLTAFTSSVCDFNPHTPDSLQELQIQKTTSKNIHVKFDIAQCILYPGRRNRIPWRDLVWSISYSHLSSESFERSQLVAGVQWILMKTRLQWKICSTWNIWHRHKIWTAVLLTT